jgi:uncharacterized membrane protein
MAETRPFRGWLMSGFGVVIGSGVASVAGTALVEEGHQPAPARTHRCYGCLRPGQSLRPAG